MSTTPINAGLMGQWFLGQPDRASNPLVASETSRSTEGNLDGNIIGGGFYCAASLEGRTCLSFDGSYSCTCAGYGFRRKCRHIEGVKNERRKR